MYGNLFCFACFFAVGTYLIVANLIGLPTLAATKAVVNIARQDKKQTQSIEAVIFQLSSKLVPYIKMDSYRKRRMAATLKSAGIAMTPEMYRARTYVSIALIGVCIIPCLLIFPLLSPVILFLTIMVFFKESRKADELLKEKREEIEYELPRFVATVAQELKASRDVLSILEFYKKSAGENFRSELEITIADMKSGNEETALTRFESRIGSAQLSDVIRGLISVKRGDNGAVYFEMLAHDFKQFEIQKLKLIAIKRPAKVRKYSFLMLACFLLVYLGVIGYQILSSFGSLF